MIILESGTEFWMKVLRLRILFSATREDSFTHFCKHVKQLYQDFSVTKVVGSEAYHRLVLQEKGKLSGMFFGQLFFTSN